MRKQNDGKPYVISECPKDPGVWYCHMAGYPYIPVAGSIGDKATAKRVCRERNVSCGKE